MYIKEVYLYIHLIPVCCTFLAKEYIWWQLQCPSPAFLLRKFTVCCPPNSEVRYLPLIWFLDVWDIACSHCCHCHCSLLLIICNIPTVPITTLAQCKWSAKQHIPQNVWLLLSIYIVCNQFSIMVAICQCAGWISVLFHPSCHHVVYVNAFQLCLWFCWHTWMQ